MSYILIFADMVKIKNSNPNKIKIDETSYKNVFIYFIGYLTFKDVR